MCQCCGHGPSCYYQNWPYEYYCLSYGYPLYGYWYPSYGLPFGYAYAPPTPPMAYAAVPQYPRGERRVGNCLMICQ